MFLELKNGIEGGDVMTIDFKTKPHSILPGVNVVEILVDGKTAGVIYPVGEKAIKLVSAHIEATKTDKDFAGEVVEDDGSGSWPPIPAVLITFNLGPYTIVGNKIVKIS